jgi:hypothetical protein
MGIVVTIHRHQLTPGFQLCLYIDNLALLDRHTRMMRGDLLFAL